MKFGMFAKNGIYALTLLLALMLSGNVFAASETAKPAEAKTEKAATERPPAFQTLSKESTACVACHKEENASVYQQWGRSKHFRANVGCYECHKADPSDKDAITHKKFTISVIVSPKDCARCHEGVVNQFDKSHHADAGKIMGSLDNVLAEVIEGHETFNGASPVAVNGCWQCHGSEIKVLKDGSLDPATWPNSGIGRLNPDGSKGACSACHQRHEFSAAQARRPENCGKCHLGPDHPQKEIYDESKHGINFYANVDKMNLASSKWIPGEDYDAAPTCATCHMSATKEMPVTHDVGSRISWTLRPPVSEKIDAQAIKAGKTTKSWEDRRGDMKNVCQSCHSPKTVENFYQQFDSLVNLYNDKFAIPGTGIMKALKDNKLINDVQFDEKIEWTWYEIWHHEGRRARHGASMMAPDYTQWHGMYEVAKHFYTDFLDEADQLIEKAAKNGNEKGAKAVRKVIDDILADPKHEWFIGKMPAELKAKRKEAAEAFKKRYAQ